MAFGKETTIIDLNGEWSFAYTLSEQLPAITTSADLEKSTLTILPATVPGNFELDLQRNGIIEDPFFGMNAVETRPYEHAHVWYFRHFTATPEPDRIAELVFDGLDCYADIYLNGQLIGSTDNMLIEHTLEVTGLLRDENELLVHIKPAVDEAKNYPYPPSVNAMPANFESVYVRKAPHMYGWDIMPRFVSAGIWRPVSLRYRPIERIESVFLETLSISQDHSRAELALNYRATTKGSPSDRYTIKIDGRCGESTISESHIAFFEAGRFNFGISNPTLWWPRGRGEASLYEVTVTLLKDGAEIDSCSFVHGIRTVKLDRTSITDASGSGEFCFHINGEKVFLMGTNWVPADAFHSRDASRLPKMLALAEDVGCNVIRCWGGNVYEDDVFYVFCDRKGILVWQDFAMACAIYPQDAEFCARLADEVRTVVRRLRHHPCIALWSGDNECDCAYSWGGQNLDPNTNVLTRRVIPDVLREEDCTRPYLPSSPYIDEVAYKADQSLLSENHLWGVGGRVLMEGLDERI
jgi:beta-mannosidase